MTKKFLCPHLKRQSIIRTDNLSTIPKDLSEIWKFIILVKNNNYTNSIQS